MSHDNDARGQSASMVTPVSPGRPHRFMCGCCNKPALPKGSKIVSHLGARVRICEACTTRWATKSRKPVKEAA